MVEYLLLRQHVSTPALGHHHVSNCVSEVTLSTRCRWMMWAICMQHCIVSSETQFETWWWPSARAETCCLSNKYSTTLLVVFWVYYLHHLIVYNTTGMSQLKTVNRFRHAVRGIVQYMQFFSIKKHTGIECILSSNVDFWGKFLSIFLKRKSIESKYLCKYFFSHKQKKIEIVENVCTDPAKYEFLIFWRLIRFLCHKE